MKASAQILAMVMAGGFGSRLYPLTSERTKPSVPFGGKYRIIDFTLSNLINSGIHSIYVLVQYKSQSLIEHIRTTWTGAAVYPKHFITVVPPQMRRSRAWYKGTADSVYQNINLIYDFSPKFVAIFAGDHVYRMNIKDMLEQHIKTNAQLTISVVPVEASQSKQFGIVSFGKDLRIFDFKEKPSHVNQKVVYASMGNYIFNADFLIKVLEEDAESKTTHDFGRDIIPKLVRQKCRVYAYDFSNNRIPSLKDYEAKYYWQDVGTISSYYKSNMDLLGDKPKFDLDNQSWPIFASNLNCPPSFIKNSVVENSLVSEGTKIIGSEIKNSILGRNVYIEENCVIEDSIIFDFCYIKKGSRIKKTIIDRFNVIESKSIVGYDVKTDKTRYYVDRSGIVVIKRAARKAL